MAIIIIFLLGLGIYMSDFLSKEAPNRMMVYNLHKSLGVLVLMLIIVRIANRFIHKAPKLPEHLSKFEKIAANLLHFFLYILMIIVPLSGYLMSNFYGYPAMFFGFEMPFLTTTNFDLGKIAAEVHEISAFTMIGAVSLHVLAAIKHFICDREMIKRML
jgi:cytochrome b561